MYQTREHLQARIAELEATERRTLAEHTFVLFQEMRDNKQLRAENARLRQALVASARWFKPSCPIFSDNSVKDAPHGQYCRWIAHPILRSAERHFSGYAQDGEEPCDCWKAALARIPEAR